MMFYWRTRTKLLANEFASGYIGIVMRKVLRKQVAGKVRDMTYLQDRKLAGVLGRRLQ